MSFPGNGGERDRMNAAAATIEERNAVLAATPFLKPHRFTVNACPSGECTVLVPFMRSLERPGGLVRGMALMGAASGLVAHRVLAYPKVEAG